jgi:ABC-2 type transport system permease protein
MTITPDHVVDPTRVPDAPLAPPSANGGLTDVFRRRYLLRLLVQKEIQARYQGSVLGLMWSYVQPMVRFLMYFLVLGLILGLHKSVPNYAMHIFSSITVVHFFTETFSSGTRSIVRNKAIVQKMAMPREMFPVASVIVSAIHVFPQLVIIVVGGFITGWRPDLPSVAAMVLSLAIVTVLGTAAALLFSALNVFFRDFQNIVQTLQIFMNWIVPAIYPFAKLAQGLEGHRLVYYLYLADPLAPAVLLMQRAVWLPTFTPEDQIGFPDVPTHLWLLGVLTLASTVVLLLVAQLAFTRLENKIAERL